MSDPHHLIAQRILAVFVVNSEHHPTLRPEPGVALPVRGRTFRRAVPPAVSLQRDLDVRPGEVQAIAPDLMLLFGAQPGTREQQRDLILQVRAWLPAVLGNQILQDALDRWVTHWPTSASSFWRAYARNSSANS